MKETELYPLIIPIPAEDIRILSSAGCLQGNHVRNWARNNGGVNPAESARTWINHHMHRRSRREALALLGIVLLVGALVAEHSPTMTPDLQTFSSMILMAPFVLCVVTYAYFSFPSKKERLARARAESFHRDLAHLRTIVSAGSLAMLDTMPWDVMRGEARRCLVKICENDLRMKQDLKPGTDTFSPSAERERLATFYNILQRFGLVGNEGFGPYYKPAIELVTDAVSVTETKS